MRRVAVSLRNAALLTSTIWPPDAGGGSGFGETPAAGYCLLHNSSGSTLERGPNQCQSCAHCGGFQLIAELADRSALGALLSVASIASTAGLLASSTCRAQGGSVSRSPITVALRTHQPSKNASWRPRSSRSA